MLLAYIAMLSQICLFTIKILTMIKIKLRELMWDKNITAIDIQRETGIHATTISKIIHNKHTNIGLETIDKLCEALDCKVQDLLEFIHINK